LRSERPAPDEGGLSGFLLRDGRRVPVRISFASRVSLYVTFVEDEALPDRSEFEALLIDLPGHQAQLSRCRLQYEYTRIGGQGRLIFLDDVYDCRALIVDRRLLNLRNFFQNLPLVQSQRDRIEPAFKQYVSDTIYDLSVYKKFFNEQDRVLANEPALVAIAGQEAILASEKKRFFEFLDAQLGQLDQLVAGFDKEQHERHGFYLRRMAWDFILGSEFYKRTNLKPRGYAGDAEMMQMLYENRYLGHYVFNKLLHKHPLEQPAAQAVRNRRVLVARKLNELRNKVGRQTKIRALSVACGPAWELQDAITAPEDAEAISFTLLDQDPAALACAQDCVRRVEASRDVALDVRYLQDSVRTMLRTPRIAEKFGRFEYIYSMGLFDYLTPPVARAVLAKSYELLAPGGMMVIGNYHQRNPNQNYMAYWLDWVLYYRTEEDFLGLASGLSGATASILFDDTRCQMFLQIDKQA
jgi:extracellular factor (EF) 3-hydroxypalmitic acid methyl ester biosynthesis protein